MDELIPFIHTAAAETNTSFTDFAKYLEHVDFDDAYEKFILIKATELKIDLHFNGKLEYTYDEHKLHTAINKIKELGFVLIQHETKHLNTFLFVRNNSEIKDNSLDTVIVTAMPRFSYINVKLICSDNKTKTDISEILNSLDTVDYSITLDTFFKDDVNSITKRMTCNGFNQPPDFFYPCINEGLSEYFNSFITSSSNILLLIGPPGTGKTHFLKSMFNYAKKNVQMTYDEKLIEDGTYFSNFIESENQFLVIEDADTILKSRSDGNKLISKFLNIADGIMPNDKKKLIFTTNLPNVKDVDKALIRPGRCFDVLEIGYLKIDEAKKVAEHIGVDPQSLTKDKYVLADIFGIKNNFKFHSKLNGFGFT
jgi:hypothetical protein